MAAYPNPPVLSAAPTNGQVPAYNATTNTWDPTTVAGTGPTGPTGPTGATGPTGSVSPSTLNAQADDYTLVIGDAGKTVEMTKGSATTLTVPLNASVAFPVGTVIDIIQGGAGKATVAATGGVTISSKGGLLSLNGQWSRAKLYKIATDTWVLTGGDALIA